MKESSNRHLKVQELCDCYAETDPLKEMSIVAREPSTDEAALKWIALAVLHGVNNNAEKISISQDTSGKVEVTAKYRTTRLPSPGEETGSKILEAIRAITHIEDNEGKIDLALGFRDNSMDLEVKVKKNKDREKVSFTFPGDN